MNKDNLNSANLLMDEINDIRNKLKALDEAPMYNKSITVNAGGVWLDMLNKFEIAMIRSRWVKILQELELKFAAL